MYSFHQEKVYFKKYLGLNNKVYGYHQLKVYMEKMITGSSVLFFDGSGSVAYEKNSIK